MTAELVVIVPSRGRPDNVKRLLTAWTKTVGGSPWVDLWVVVDWDDPERIAYMELWETRLVQGRLTVQQGSRGLNAILNRYATEAAETARVVGFMGDDHLPSTDYWDERILEAITGRGVAYGNDLLQGANLPTAAFITADLIRELGFFAPPALGHLYLDNFWLELGRATSLHYLPDVIIEHLHPVAGKAEWDPGYTAVNGHEASERDRAAWERFLVEDWPAIRARLHVVA